MSRIKINVLVFSNYFLKYNTDYDQLILETANHLDFWIHVSCRRDPKLNRHKVVYYMKKVWRSSVWQ